MKITVADTAGFCGGVKRAIEIATKKRTGSRLVLGSLIHNKRVIEQLKSEGISFSDEPKRGYDCYIVSAHGIPFSMYSDLQSDSLADATCPIVKKLFSICENATEVVLLVGDIDHVEIKNAVSYVKTQVEVLSTHAVEIERLERLAQDKEKKFVLAFQTTLSKKSADKYKNAVIRLFGERVRIFDTLCPSVSKRINEGKEIAGNVDRMIVIGDKASANCNTLYEECKAVNSNTIFVENANDVPLLDDECVGMTAGASVPDEIIQEVYEKLNLM